MPALRPVLQSLSDGGSLLEVRGLTKDLAKDVSFRRNEMAEKHQKILFEQNDVKSRTTLQSKNPQIHLSFPPRFAEWGKLQRKSI